MNWEKAICEDKIHTVGDDFYRQVLRKRQRHVPGPVFHKSHFWMSIAAGIMVGLLFSGIYKQQEKKELYRNYLLTGWMNDCYINEMELENIELRIFD